MHIVRGYFLLWTPFILQYTLITVENWISVFSKFNIIVYSQLLNDWSDQLGIYVHNCIIQIRLVVWYNNMRGLFEVSFEHSENKKLLQSLDAISFDNLSSDLKKA